MRETDICPFCGHLPVAAKSDDGMWNIQCETVDCPGENDIWWETSDEAIDAWNTRYEPTCHDFGGEEGTNGEGYDFACSACGYLSDIIEPNYCPNCGAKVIEE